MEGKHIKYLVEVAICELVKMNSSIGTDVVREYQQSPDYYWDDIDKICDAYTTRILSESDFLLNSCYDIGQNVFSLQCGLSPARDFEPAIKILKKTDGAKITFCVIEWEDFVQQLRKFIETYFDKNLDPDTAPVLIESNDKIKIQPSTFLNAKILIVTTQMEAQTFYLSEVIVREIIKISGIIIKNRISLLKRINFLSFYRNFLHLTNKLQIYANYQLSPDNIMSAFCEILTDSLEANAMHDCLFYYKTKMLEDLSALNR